jgi:hypothetical protein
MSAFTSQPYAAMSRLSRKSQRLAMHVRAKGFHGLSEFDAMRLKNLMGRVMRVPKPSRRTEAEFLKKQSAKHEQKSQQFDQRRSQRATAFALRHRAISRRRGLGDCYQQDSLSGSLDGTGGAYGERVNVKARQGRRLTLAEKTFIRQQRRDKRELKHKAAVAERVAVRQAFFGPREARHQARVAGRVAGRVAHRQDRVVFRQGVEDRRRARRVSPPSPAAVAAGNPTLSDYEGVGLGAPKWLKKISKIGRKYASAVVSVSTLGRAQIYKGSLTDKEKKKFRKFGAIVGGTALAIGGGIIAGGLIKGAMAAKAAAAAKGLKALSVAKSAASGGGLLSKISAGKALWSKARKTLGLPALSMGSLRKASPEAAAAQDAGAAAAGNAQEMMDKGLMSQEQADEYVRNAVRMAEEKAAAAQAETIRLAAEASAEQARLTAARMRAEQDAEADRATAAAAKPEAAGDQPPTTVRAGFGTAGLAGIAAAALLLFMVAGKTVPEKVKR